MTATDPRPATPVDLPTPAIGSLSPSRATDFMTCPLLYRFRSIDRLPERPSPEAVRGSLVHAVLERLFDLPAAERTSAAARALVGPTWTALRDTEPALAAAIADSGFDDPADWLTEVEGLVTRYFELEDPRRLQPAERELAVEVVLDSGLRLRGVIDRLDVSSTGAVRVVDYKTGRVPSEAFEGRALFQMKFYALVLWRLHGSVPRLLQLVYLREGEILRYVPDEADLRATERKLQALWAAIERATRLGDFRARPSRLCDWCDHRPLCPAHGGTPPPFPHESADIPQPRPEPRPEAAPSAPHPDVASSPARALLLAGGTASGDVVPPDL
jgi:putative RecB family exonuclease